MARVITISFKDEDAWIVDELKKHHSSLSAAFVAMSKEYLLRIEDEVAQQRLAPEWYVSGKDYSHLGEDEKAEIRRFGYTGD